MSQVVHLCGVLDDGSDLVAPTPLNSAKTIQIPLMSAVTIEIALVNNAGAPVDLKTGAPVWQAFFTIVTKPDSCAQAAGVGVDYQLLSVALKGETRNTIVFAIPQAALRRFPAGRYFYDVSLTLRGLKYQIVRISGIHLEMALRRA